MTPAPPTPRGLTPLSRATYVAAGEAASPPGEAAATPVSTSEIDERPAPSARVHMHPLTLRFAEPLETEFSDEYLARTLSQVRLALLLATFLYTAFGVLDIWIAPGQRRELWVIRYAVITPLFLSCFALSFAPWFRRVREIAVGTVVLLAALGIVAMTMIIPAPGSYLYYAGLLLAIMYAFTLVRLSLTSATLISVLTIAAYLVVALRINLTPVRLVTNNIFFLVATFLIGFLSHYSMERYARVNFLQRRTIARRTRELELANEELRAKHRMLLESRATTARTARRSELMFSALADALPGTVLDEKYRVQEKIGTGSVGTVYRGEHLFLHHAVAIKIFRPAVGQTELESLDRFRLEGISACRINHPNAVTVLDFDVSAGCLAYLVMELLEGRSLAEELRSAGRLSPRRCVRIALAVCEALAEAHAAGIVHRDIKPANVFLHQYRGAQLVKVIDFGIAKLTDESVDPGLLSITAAGMFLGTPAYIPPERLLGEPYDGRADVYAVGVIMYEMLTGRRPFDRQGAHTSAGGGSQERPCPPGASTLVPEIPPALEVVIGRAMSFEPEQRPTAAELAAELRRLDLDLTHGSQDVNDRP